MGTLRFIPEINLQITERGYSVTEVSERPDVSAHSLYKWLRTNSEQHARYLLEAKSEILKPSIHLFSSDVKTGFCSLSESGMPPFHRRCISTLALSGNAARKLFSTVIQICIFGIAAKENPETGKGVSRGRMSKLLMLDWFTR